MIFQHTMGTINKSLGVLTYVFYWFSFKIVLFSSPGNKGQDDHCTSWLLDSLTYEGL